MRKPILACFLAGAVLSVPLAPRGGHLTAFPALPGGGSGRTAPAPPRGTPVFRDPRQPVDSRVSDLLSRMTLEEKAAQLLCIWKLKKDITDADGMLIPGRARSRLDCGIGHIARASENTSGGPNPGPRRTAEIANAFQKWLRDSTRLGIPALVHEEGLHGQQAAGATSFPQAIALASSWDPDLVERVFSAVALEIRARGGHQALTPVLDVARDPRWGRYEETYGEDPFLNARIGAACIRGFQGGGGVIDARHVAATAKHFAAHGTPEGGLNCAPTPVPERVLRDVMLPPFRAAVQDAGVMSVMATYNEIDGIPCSANRWLLTDLLRGEWGFDGVVVSDYESIDQLVSVHRVAEDARDAARQALGAGVDAELPDMACYATLADQVRAGRVDGKALDRAAARVLRLKFLCGLFENPFADPDAAEKATRCPAHRRLAYEAAVKSMVLLKNGGGLLPLDRRAVRRLAVVGPNASGLHLGGYAGEPRIGVDVLGGLKAKLAGSAEIVYSEGCKIVTSDGSWWTDEVTLSDPEDDAASITAAVAAVRGCDAAVVVVGENEQTGREAWSAAHLGDRADLNLLGRQQALVDAVLETGVPTVVVLINGRPLSVGAIAERAPALLECWYLGEATGTALADALFGDACPGGKLPATFPRSVGHLPAAYAKKPSVNRGYLFEDMTPVFPFGHGLSYTSFRLSGLRVEPSRIGTAGRATVSVEVTNTGTRTGDEVVQLYVRDRLSSAARPVMELRGFRRVTLAPGETRSVDMEITPQSLSFWTRDRKEAVEPGWFDLLVGPDSAHLEGVALEVADG